VAYDLCSSTRKGNIMIAKRIRVALGLAFLGLVLSTGTAVAQTLPGDGCSVPCPRGDVSGEDIGAQSPAPAVPATVTTVPTRVEAETSAPAGTLPLTGGDIAGLVIIGGVAIGAGTLMVRRTRNRTTA
jgi:LPXTG-motif cell wall-anchored protein